MLKPQLHGTFLFLLNRLMCEIESSDPTQDEGCHSQEAVSSLLLIVCAKASCVDPTGPELEIPLPGCPEC